MNTPNRRKLKENNFKDLDPDEFIKTAESFEKFFTSAKYSIDPRAAGRPKKGEVVEESETFSVRLPKGMMDQITEAAHRFGVSRNRFIKIGAMRMISDPILENEVQQVSVGEDYLNLVFSEGKVQPLIPLGQILGITPPVELKPGGKVVNNYPNDLPQAISDLMFAGVSR